MPSRSNRWSASAPEPPKRATAEESPLVCRVSRDSDGGRPDESDVEWTFFEGDRDPECRLTRWITADAASLVPEDDWQ